MNSIIRKYNKNKCNKARFCGAFCSEISNTMRVYSGVAFTFCEQLAQANNIVF